MRSGSVGLRTTVTPERTMVCIKSRLSETMRKGTPARLGETELPAVVGATRTADGIRILCTSPAEWLLSSTQTFSAAMRDAIVGDCKIHQLVYADVSAGSAVIDVSGPDATEVLSKGCGIDLHPKIFSEGQCARTRFAQIALIIDFVQSPDRFELYVGRSYVHYLQDWLKDSAPGFF